MTTLLLVTHDANSCSYIASPVACYELLTSLPVLQDPLSQLVTWPRHSLVMYDSVSLPALHDPISSLPYMTRSFTVTYLCMSPRVASFLWSFPSIVIHNPGSLPWMDDAIPCLLYIAYPLPVMDNYVPCLLYMTYHLPVMYNPISCPSLMTLTPLPVIHDVSCMACIIVEGISKMCRSERHPFCVKPLVVHMFLPRFSH